MPMIQVDQDWLLKVVQDLRTATKALEVLTEILEKQKPRKPKKSGMSDAAQIEMARRSYGDY